MSTSPSAGAYEPLPPPPLPPVPPVPPPDVGCDSTETLLADLPPYLANDPMVQRLMKAYGRELGRIDCAARAIIRGFFGSSMSDVPILSRYLAPTMAMWERLLGLPVQPDGVGTSERRAKVLAYIQKRNSGAGADWVALLQLALGRAFTYEEGPGDYQVTISLPLSGSPYTRFQVQALARAITPAHLDIGVVDTERFVIGVTPIGDPL